GGERGFGAERTARPMPVRGMIIDRARPKFTIIGRASVSVTRPSAHLGMQPRTHLRTYESPSFMGFVPFGAFAMAVIMTTPVLFLPFLLTFTGRFTSWRAPHCGPASRPGWSRWTAP